MSFSALLAILCVVYPLVFKAVADEAPPLNRWHRLAVGLFLLPGTVALDVAAIGKLVWEALTTPSTWYLTVTLVDALFAPRE